MVAYKTEIIKAKADKIKKLKTSKQTTPLPTVVGLVDAGFVDVGASVLMTSSQVCAVLLKLPTVRLPLTGFVLLGYC